MTDLNPSEKYTVALSFKPEDNVRYTYREDRWLVKGKAKPDKEQLYMHPQSPKYGSYWMSELAASLVLEGNAFEIQERVRGENRKRLDMISKRILYQLDFSKTLTENKKIPRIMEIIYLIWHDGCACNKSNCIYH